MRDRIPDHAFEAADIRLDQRTKVIAGRFLSTHATAFGNVVRQNAESACKIDRHEGGVG